MKWFRLSFIFSYAYYADEPCGWFRIFGYGIQFKPYNAFRYFSERYGYKKWVTIGKYKFALLTPKST